MNKTQYKNKDNIVLKVEKKDIYNFIFQLNHQFNISYAQMPNFVRTRIGNAISDKCNELIILSSDMYFESDSQIFSKILQYAHHVDFLMRSAKNANYIQKSQYICLNTIISNLINAAKTNIEEK